MRTTWIAVLSLSWLAACGPIGGVEADDNAASSAGGTTSAGTGGMTGAGLVGAGGARPANPHQRTALVWIWQDYRLALNAVLQNQNSFTHVSPAIYQMNYDYRGGPVKDEVPGGYYAGLNGRQMASALHSAGIKIVPLIFAGAGNNGVDTGIQNVLSNPTVAQSFIDSQVQLAVDNGYDGWNLDWEVGGGVTDQSSAALISFLGSFKQALNAHGMELSYDLGGWYVKQCNSSGYSGVVDITAFGAVVDQAIIEDYAGSLEGPTTGCPATVPSMQMCDTFGDQLQLMCSSKPASAESIGLITPGSNAFAPSALQAVASYGYQNIALWPDDSGFLNPKGMPDGSTWFSVLANWLQN